MHVRLFFAVEPARKVCFAFRAPREVFAKRLKNPLKAREPAALDHTVGLVGSVRPARGANRDEKLWNRHNRMWKYRFLLDSLRVLSSKHRGASARDSRTSAKAIGDNGAQRGEIKAHLDGGGRRRVVGNIKFTLFYIFSCFEHILHRWWLGWRAISLHNDSSLF